MGDSAMSFLFCQTGMNRRPRLLIASKIAVSRLLLILFAATLAGQTPKPGEVRANPKDQQKYVWIPAGSFVLGCSLGDIDCDADERPPFEAEISQGFWIG